MQPPMSYTSTITATGAFGGLKRKTTIQNRNWRCFWSMQAPLDPYSHDGPIRRGKRGYILTSDQLDA
eukprot:4695998-Pyramimonas_sp.AAC.1